MSRPSDVPTPSGGSPDLTALLLDQRQRWRQGDRALVEEYLVRHPTLAADSDAVLDLLYNEMVAREEQGEAPRPTEYLNRFPDLAPQLHELLEVHRAFDGGQGDPPTVRRDTRAPGLPGRPVALTWPQVPGYEMLDLLGRGGMGVVWKARHEKLGRLVALKMIALLGPDAAEAAARFRREAQALAGLQHPNIVQVFEVGEHDGQPYLALEFVDGGSLAVRLQGRPLPATVAARLVEVLARAAHHAHQRGLVHRDLKPGNILLASGGCQPPGDSALSSAPSPGGLRPPLAGDTPKIADFGLAKHVGPAVQAADPPTQTGAILGTPSYMAPEQARGRSREIGPAADVYSLGAILYECLTGRPPFQGESPLETLEQSTTQDPVPPSRLQPRCPRDLETVCLKCLQKEPRRRYVTAEGLAEDLARFLEDRPILARPLPAWARAGKWARRRPAVAALAAALALVLVAAFGLVTWQMVQANVARRDAETARDTAESALADRSAAVDKLRDQVQRTREEARKAEETLRAKIYSDGIALADREWREGNVINAARVLEECRPASRPPWEWGFLRRRCATGQMDVGMQPGATSVAIRPDGRLLATGGDRTIYLWPVAAGKPPRILRGHQHRVRAVAFDRTGRRLVSAGDDHTVRLWEPDQADKGTLLAHLDGIISSVAFHPDGGHVLTVNGNGPTGAVQLWKVPSGERVRTYGGNFPGVAAVAVSPDGRWVAACGGRGIVKVWDVATGKEQHTLPWRPLFPLSVAFHPNGTRIAAGADDNLRPGEAKVWDTVTGREVCICRGHSSSVTFVAFSPDGARLATASLDKTVRVWDAATGHELMVFRGHAAPVRAVVFHADGNRLASVGDDNLVKLWNTAAHQEAIALTGHINYVEGVAFHPDGQRVASAGRDGTVRVWDAQAGRQVRCFVAHPLGPEQRSVWTTAFSPDGKRLASAGRDRDVKVWDIDTPDGKPLCCCRHGAAVNSVRSLGFSPDGRFLATAGMDEGNPAQPGEVKLWDAATGREVRAFVGHRHGAYAVAFSPDGRRLASAGADWAVKLWDVSDGRCLWTWTDPRTVIWQFAFSPDGAQLYGASQDGTVRAWDAASGKERASFRGHARPVQAVALHPDGNRLASASLDGTIRLWDVDNGREALALSGHVHGTNCVAFSGDGRRLASGGWDARVKVWDASPAEPGRRP